MVQAHAHAAAVKYQAQFPTISDRTENGASNMTVTPTTSFYFTPVDVA